MVGSPHKAICSLSPRLSGFLAPTGNVITAFPDELLMDVGEPAGTCTETAPNSGVCTRAWSTATVQMDCNTYKGTVTPL